MNTNNRLKSAIKSMFAYEDRVFGLDLLRFMAIMLVVLGHSRWMVQTFPKPLKAILHGSGILGVELFFVLSGFLIGGILLKTYDKHNQQLDFGLIKDFWVRRWFRTLPNYYLILVVYLLVYWDGRPEQLWKYVFFIQNAFTYPPYFFEESWSLAIEELSYFISPLALAFFSFLFVRKGKPVQAAFLWVSLLLIGIVSCLRFYYIQNEIPKYANLPNFSWQYMLREVALIRLDAIYFGFLAVYLNKRFPEVWQKYRHFTAILGLIGLGSIMAFSGSLMDKQNNTFVSTLFFSLMSLSIAFLLPLLSSMKTAPLRLLAAPVTFISVISYSMYLLNGGLISWQFSFLFNEGKGYSSLQMVGIYLLYWTVCIGLSSLLYLFYERPFTALRDKYSSK